MYAWTNECTLTCTIIISVFLFFFFNNPILSHLLKKNPTFSPPSICQNLNRQSIHIPKLPLYIHVSHYQRWIFIFRNNIIELPTIFSKFFFVKIFSFSHSLSFSHLASFVSFSDLLRVVLTQKDKRKKSTIIFILNAVEI